MPPQALSKAWVAVFGEKEEKKLVGFRGREDRSGFKLNTSKPQYLIDSVAEDMFRQIEFFERESDLLGIQQGRRWNMFYVSIASQM